MTFPVHQDILVGRIHALVFLNSKDQASCRPFSPPSHRLSSTRGADQTQTRLSETLLLRRPEHFSWQKTTNSISAFQRNRTRKAKDYASALFSVVIGGVTRTSSRHADRARFHHVLPLSPTWVTRRKYGVLVLWPTHGYLSIPTLFGNIHIFRARHCTENTSGFPGRNTCISGSCCLTLIWPVVLFWLSSF